jgi:hypothetical protein
MTMQDKQFADKITGYLDQGTASLRAGTAYRLQQARAAALARLDPSYAVAPGMTPAFAGGPRPARRQRDARGWHAGAARWVGILLIVGAAAFGWQQWHAVQQVRELQDLDAQLLSSDLPIDAYLDRGFLNWLKSDGEP